MNTLELQGQISKIYHGRNNSIVTLYTRGRRANLPQLVFTGRSRNLLDEFAEGDYVRISGSVKTRGERIGDEGRILHTQFLKGEEIEAVDYVDGEAFPYVNDVIINGEIIRATTDRSMVTLLVRPDDEKFNIWLFQYVENPDEAVLEFEVGSRISAQCEIQTVRKEIRGEVKFFENVVIKDANVRSKAE